MARRSDHTRQELTQLALDSARTIVIDEGIAGLSGRKVTERIGYTVGTLYQLFDGMDDLVEQMNARTLAVIYEYCADGAKLDDAAQQLKVFGLRFVGFVKTHLNEWDAVMSYRYKEGHTTSDAYQHQIDRLFGLMETATRQFYNESEQDEHAADMAMLWASLMGIFGVANSERVVGGMSLEQMLDQLIRMYLRSRSP